MKLLILAAASLAVVSCASLSLEDLEFHAWKLKFGKVYRTPEEEARRKDIWLSTRHRVLAHNILADQGIKTYRMGMNHFSDMDEKEYYTALNGSRFHLDFMKSTHQCDITDFKTGAQLPGSVDWRDKGCVTPVKDQGQSCGSCWAFSAVGALESHTCIKHKRLTALSEQQLVDCAKKHGCNSGTALDAFGYCMKSQGIVKEKDYQYKFTESTCPFTKKISSKKIGAKCTGCRRVQTDEKSLQQEVAERGPVSVTVIYHKSLDNYKSGVYYEPGCAKIPPQKRDYHSMLVVGYGTTKKGEKYWLVKNSYSTSWGEDGYVRMARNKKNNCLIATYAFYPLVK